MKKFGFARSIIAIACTAVVGFSAVASHARPQINTQFKGKYIQPDANGSAKKFADAVATAKCNVCHVGAKKTDRNRYGQELAKLLGKNEKDKKKIEEALDKVANTKIDEKDPKSPSYGDLIKDGNLPGGEEEKK